MCSLIVVVMIVLYNVDAMNPSQFHMGFGKRGGGAASGDQQQEDQLKRFDAHNFHMGFGKRYDPNNFHVGFGAMNAGKFAYFPNILCKFLKIRKEFFSYSNANFTPVNVTIRTTFTWDSANEHLTRKTIKWADSANVTILMRLTCTVTDRTI
jgi:hypothetical protein